MHKIILLIKKDLQVDWRQQNPITGILLYLLTTIFSLYMVFSGVLSAAIWNALYWMIILFTATSAISKSFSQEDRRSHFYFFLCTPVELLVAKMVYSFLYLFVLVLISLLIYSILFGYPVEKFSLFILNLMLGSLGLSSAFTMVSAISFRAKNTAILSVVLGFPIVIPVLILSMSNSSKILEGFIFMQIQGNLISLLSLDVIIIALSFVLFPFIWKS